MAPKREDVMKLIEVLSEQENLHATAVGSAKATLFAAVCTFTGGILGGPVGIFVGGTIGSASAAMYSRGKFKSVISIINEDMTKEQRTRLLNAVREVLNSISAQDVTMIMMILAQNPSLKAAVVGEIGSFLKKEMYMSLTSS